MTDKELLEMFIKCEKENAHIYRCECGHLFLSLHPAEPPGRQPCWHCREIGLWKRITAEQALEAERTGSPVS